MTVANTESYIHQALHGQYVTLQIDAEARGATATFLPSLLVLQGASRTQLWASIVDALPTFTIA